MTLSKIKNGGHKAKTVIDGRVYQIGKSRKQLIHTRMSSNAVAFIIFDGSILHVSFNQY